MIKFVFKKVPFMKSLFFALVLCSGLFAFQNNAEARGSILDVHLGFKYVGGAGGALGARFALPIVPNLVPGVDNVLYFSIGGDLYLYRDSVLAIGIPIGLNWSFYFHEKFSAFVELGISPAFALGGDFLIGLGVGWLGAALGFRFHFTEALALHIRLGSPYSSLGLEFAF